MSLLAGFIYRQFLHKPPVPTKSFQGRTVIVTGSNVGLGLEACRWLVRLGASKVILACRNVDKGKAAAKDIQTTTSCSQEILEVWHLDMSSYASVQAFAAKARATLPRLDALIANAGIGTREFRMTEDNEETITTNVVSLSLLAMLLFPKLHETAEQFKTQTHLTVTASELYEVAKFKERMAPAGKLFATLADQGQSNMSDRYNVSKLLQVFIIKQIAALCPLSTCNVIVNCVAPGLCDTELHREIDFAFIHVLKMIICRQAEVGARTLVYGASAGPESHGQYLPDCVIRPTKGLSKGAKGVELQTVVWAELTQKIEAIQEGATNIP